MTVNNAIIIGLSGYAQSGKDTVGSILVEKHGFQRFAFADYLREVCCAFDPIVGSTSNFVECDLQNSGLLRFSEVLAMCGYEQAKAQFPEFRRALQHMGTEVVRHKIKDSFWVDHVFEQIKEGNVERAVITDARFPNEARAVEQNGVSVWIERPGVGPVNSHVSDNSLDNWVFDFTIENNSDLEALGTKVAELVHTVVHEVSFG